MTGKRVSARFGAAFGAVPLLMLLAAPALAEGDCDASPADGVNWSECRKRNLLLNGSELSGANLAGADFSSSDLRKSQLKSAVFEKAALARAMLDGSNAAGANFEKALGYRTSFVEADLAGARFAKSEMQRADFKDAILTGADFEKSELGRVMFTGAEINGTKFSFSNLARADFRGAVFDTPIDFTSAYFYRTRLEGMDLSKATGIVQWQIDLACGDPQTKLPAGIVAPTTWPCADE